MIKRRYSKVLTHPLVIMVAVLGLSFSMLQSHVSAANAVTDTGVCPLDFYQDNDITTYNKCAAAACTENNGTTIDIATGDLPSDTIKYIESLEVKQKVEKNMARYVHAQKQTGIPWQVMAALHFREAMLDPSRSIFNGQVLANRDANIDDHRTYADANKDAEAAAKLFIANAEGNYGIDLKQSNVSIDRWGLAFLAYNRGGMYKNWGKAWQESPYVVNGFDVMHMNMKWIDADSYVKPGGKKLNSLAGKEDGNKAGALTVFKYLGGLSGAGAANTTSQAQTSAATFDCPSVGGAGATIVGDMAFPLAGNRSVVTSPGMFKNNTTDRGGHPYIAFDIMSKIGTKVVGMMAGKVTRIGNDKCGTTMVGVFNEQNNLTISYLHIKANLAVKVGDTISPGSHIGDTAPGPCGTPSHLHIDAARGARRPGCKRENCPVANQKFFVDIGPQLFTLWQSVPSQ